MCGGGLMLRAEFFLRQHGHAPDSPYHIHLLYKGDILNADWVLAGRNMSDLPTMPRYAVLLSHAGLGLLDKKQLATVRARKKMPLAKWLQHGRLSELHSLRQGGQNR